MRIMPAGTAERKIFLARIASLERRYDAQFKFIFSMLRELKRRRASKRGKRAVRTR